MIKRAEDIAKQVHQNQKDKKGYPYMSHIYDIAKRVSHLGERYEVVALLHDAIEDAEPESFKEEIKQKITRSFDKEIVQGIEAMSKKEGDDYFNDYLPRLKKNKIALEVKIADSSHNLSKAHLLSEEPQLQEKLRTKYAKVLNELGVDAEKCEIPINFHNGTWV